MNCPGCAKIHWPGEHLPVARRVFRYDENRRNKNVAKCTREKMASEYFTLDNIHIRGALSKF